VAERDGKPRKAFNRIEQQRIYIYREYDLVLGTGEIEPTGRLVIAKLQPADATTGKWPVFVLRWDNKDDRVDVDPVNVSSVETREFEKGTSNYYGHHSERVGSNPRVFEVNLGWHGQQVYHGKISFSLGREAESKVKLVLTPKASRSSSKGNG